MPEGLKVCVNAQLIDGVSGGVQQIVVGMAQGLSELRDGDESYLFRVYRGQGKWLEPFLKGPCRLWECGEAPQGVSKIPGALRPLLRAAANAPLLWRLNARRKGRVPASDGSCEREGVELVHFPYQDGFLTGLPTIYQPHDLQHLALPEFFRPAEIGRREIQYRALCGQSWATVLMTRWGKRDLMKHYGLPNHQVAVVPGGAVTSGYPEPGAEDLDALRARLGFGEGFAYYPAHTFRHKNHARLIRALGILKREGLVVNLLCSGGLDAYHAELEALVSKEGLEGQVKFAGYLKPVEVAGAYRLAKAMVFPSLFEGWGLPVTEAMERGLPVAVSSACGLPEQVADAALIFDPLEPASIAGAIRRIWTEEGLRADLKARALRRAQQLTWVKAARIFRALYRKAAGRALDPEDQAMVDEAFRP